MKRSAIPDPLVAELVNLAMGSGSSLDQRLAQLKSLRHENPDVADFIERSLLERIEHARSSLDEARRRQAELSDLVQKVMATPWIPAVFGGQVPTPVGLRAIVLHGNARRVVALAPEIKPELLKVGDQVYLNTDLSLITCISPEGLPRCGEVGRFERRTLAGELVLKWRDDELVLQPAQALADAPLQNGDLVRFDRAAWMAFDKIESVRAKEFLLEEVPDLSREMLGGQDANYETMFTALSAILLAPEKARSYGLSGKNSILMEGPAGCGKTHMSRIIVSEIGRMSHRKVRFAVVKPAAWERPYVGETQMAIRDTFKALGESAREGMAVLLLDELEAFCRARGQFANVHGDRHLAALLAELDGFQDRKDIAILAATNRKDLLDPALLSRFAVEIRVDRPDADAARAIFRIHLPPSLPFSPNGERAASTQEEIIETAVSLFYAPNADNAVCRLRFRDSKERRIYARDLVSGRFFAQVCEGACRRAFVRELQGGEAGVNMADMEHAVAAGMQRLRTLLTPSNAQSHLADLPQDTDVVSVEPVVRKVAGARRYLNLDPL